jgi:hypothetical protein
MQNYTSTCAGALNNPIFYNGWLFCASSVAGPQGATGTQGSTGAQGAQGPVGPTGPQGATGTQGSTGAQGAQGPVGPTGPTGPAFSRTFTLTSSPTGPLTEEQCFTSSSVATDLGTNNIDPTNWCCSSGGLNSLNGQAALCPPGTTFLHGQALCKVDGTTFFQNCDIISPSTTICLPGVPSAQISAANAGGLPQIYPNFGLDGNNPTFPNGQTGYVCKNRNQGTITRTICIQLTCLDTTP